MRGRLMPSRRDATRACDSRRDSSSASPASKASACARLRAVLGAGEKKSALLPAEAHGRRKGDSGSDSAELKLEREPYMAAQPRYRATKRIILAAERSRGGLH